MSKITPNLLNDTLTVMALARETALARGGQAQAERLTPVVEGLRTVLTTPPPTSVAPSGALAQSDFQSLLSAAQAAPLQAGALAHTDRSQVAAAMAAGGMAEVEVARQLGITREEVRLMLASQSAAPAQAVNAAQVRGRYQA